MKRSRLGLRDALSRMGVMLYVKSCQIVLAEQLSD
jgi:hypothetical protein